MTKRIEFEVLDHGIDGEQYWPGYGTSFSKFKHAITGIGDSALEAGEDALDQVAMVVDDYRDSKTTDLWYPMSLAVSQLSNVDDAHSGCEHATDADLSHYAVSEPRNAASVAECECHEGCEMHHYVSIRWREVEES